MELDSLILAIAGFGLMLLPVPFILGAYLEGKRRERRGRPEGRSATAAERDNALHGQAGPGAHV